MLSTLQVIHSRSSICLWSSSEWSWFWNGNLRKPAVDWNYVWGGGQQVVALQVRRGDRQIEV